MSKRQEQTSIPGTEPVEIPAVRDALHQWLDKKDERATASESVRLSHDVLMARMLEAGVDRYAYVDAVSGKRKHVVADKTPKAKTINAPLPKREGRRGRDRDVETPGDRVDAVEQALDRFGQAIAALPDDVTVTAGGRSHTVEKRRVSRDSVEAEIDPFAATRALMDAEMPRP